MSIAKHECSRRSEEAVMQQHDGFRGAVGPQLFQAVLRQGRVDEGGFMTQQRHDDTE